jgi:hypothetical protein
MKASLAKLAAYWERWNQVYRSQVSHDQEQYFEEYVDVAFLPGEDRPKFPETTLAAERSSACL